MRSILPEKLHDLDVEAHGEFGVIWLGPVYLVYYFYFIHDIHD
jgi:hypothetical protein